MLGSSIAPRSANGDVYKMGVRGVFSKVLETYFSFMPVLPVILSFY